MRCKFCGSDDWGQWRSRHQDDSRVRICNYCEKEDVVTPAQMQHSRNAMREYYWGADTDPLVRKPTY